jgi:hypothetical protein
MCIEIFFNYIFICTHINIKNFLILLNNWYEVSHRTTKVQFGTINENNWFLIFWLSCFLFQHSSEWSHVWIQMKNYITGLSFKYFFKIFIRYWLSYKFLF